MTDHIPAFLDVMTAVGVEGVRLFPERGVAFEPRDGYIFLDDPLASIPLLNGAFITGRAAPPIDELRQVRAGLAARELPFGLQLIDGWTADADQIVKELGLQEDEIGLAMRLAPDDLRDRTTDAASCEACTEPEHLAEMVSIVAEVFEADEIVFAPLRRTLEPGIRETFFGVVAREEDEPVATAAAIVLGGGALLVNVATRAPWRRRGIGTAVTAAALRGGFALGAQIAWLVAGPDGVGPYRSVGFTEIATIRLFA